MCAALHSSVYVVPHCTLRCAAMHRAGLQRAMCDVLHPTVRDVLHQLDPPQPGSSRSALAGRGDHDTRSPAGPPWQGAEGSWRQ